MPRFQNITAILLGTENLPDTLTFDQLVELRATTLEGLDHVKAGCIRKTLENIAGTGDEQFFSVRTWIESRPSDVYEWRERYDPRDHSFSEIDQTDPNFVTVRKRCSSGPPPMALDAKQVLEKVERREFYVTPDQARRLQEVDPDGWPDILRRWAGIASRPDEGQNWVSHKEMKKILDKEFSFDDGRNGADLLHNPDTKYLRHCHREKDGTRLWHTTTTIEAIRSNEEGKTTKPNQSRREGVIRPVLVIGGAPKRPD